MKTLTILFVIILFCGCNKKSLPHFQNAKQPAFVSKNSFNNHKIAHVDNVEQIDDQNPSIASVSLNELFTKENLVKEKLVVNVQEETTFHPKNQRVVKIKWRQIIKIKKSQFEEKPKNEKVNDAVWASTFGYITLGLIVAGIIIAFFTPLAIMLITPSIITANIGLLLGAFSLKKTEKRGKAKFGIAIGVIWDIILLFLIIWILNY